MAFVEENELQDGRKTYTIRWRNASGKFQRKTLPNKREAERFALRIENEIADGNSTDALVKNSKTFRDVAEASMTASAHRLKSKTAVGYESAYRMHIYPVFGARRIATITGMDIEAWVTDMQTKVSERTGKPLSAASVHGAYVALSKAFAYAAKHRLITANPCAVVDKPRIVKEERGYLMPGEVAKVAAILDACAPYGLIVRFAAFTGLRAGELAALKIGDVSLMHKRVEVRRTLHRIKGGWEVGTPKTARSRRAVPLSAALLAQLEPYLAQHPHRADPEAALWPGRVPGGNGDVRLLDYDRQFDVASLIRYYFKPALAQLGITGVHWHDLRHFYASLLLATKRYDLHEISKWMGHASYATTVDLYGHLLDATPDMDAMDSLMSAASTPVAPLRSIGG